MRIVLILLAPILIVANLQADDWPQWMGPQRDAVWREQGIVREFPADGLPVKWRVPVNHGYGGPAVQGGKVFVMDYVTDDEVANSPDSVSRLAGQERVLCFDVDSGEQLWEYAYPQAYRISYAGGPRCTPTVANGRVYTLGAEGMLTCLQADTGALVWRKNLPEAYKTSTAIWGYASHPLLDGNLLYTLAGGDGTVCVALNQDTGEQVWSALSADEPGYNAPTMIEQAGVQQLIIWTPAGLNSLNPRTGSVYWTLDVRPSFGMSIMGARKLGNYLYVSAIGNNSALVELDETKPGAKVVWRGKPKTSVFCSNSTPFLWKDTIYGCDVETGALMAARLSDGERLWQTTAATDRSPRRSRHATAFLVRHQDRFLLFNELGDLILADLSPAGYRELGRFHMLQPTNEAFGRPVVWSHPAFANRCVFARNDKELICVDLADRDYDLGNQYRAQCLAVMHHGDGSHEAYEKALGLIEKACELVPDHPEFLAVKAWALYRTDRTDLAYFVLDDIETLLKQPRWNDPAVKQAVAKTRLEY